MANRFIIQDFPNLPDGVPMPDSVVKKLSSRSLLKEKRLKVKQENYKNNCQLRNELIKRTFKYMKEYEDLERERLLKKRTAITNGSLYREQESNFFLCIRLKGVNKIPPKPKKILDLFRLRQLNNAVFIKNNKATMNMLKKIEPYVTYGTPSYRVIRDMIYKRGYVKVGKRGAWSRKRIQDNGIISSYLGKYGIHGVEDMIHELYTCGSHFKEVNNFLWPFKLKPPTGGWTSKRHGFTDPRGGDWGSREIYINNLIDRMN